MDSNKDGNENHYGHHHLQQQTNQISFGMMQSTSSSSAHHGNFNLSKDGGSYDMGELDQALFLYLDGQDQSAQEHRQNSSISRPYTLNIFPSQPMHVEPPPETSKAKNGLVSSPMTSGSKRSSEPSMEFSNPRNDVASVPQHKAVKREGNRRGVTSSSEQEGPKTPDPKTLRRLAQNREAARKSRLRKKAYVQQLESSRLRLTQLEQEIQRARNQGFHIGGNAVLGGEQGLQVLTGNITSDAAALFDMEYGRWLDEHYRLMVDLRRAVHDHMPETELRVYVDNCLAQYDQLINIKSAVASKDVFHLVSGIWKTPAERCFVWIGGFRPSELIKIIPSHIEPLTETQLMAICGLQQSTREAEEALSQGMEALNSSVSQTLASDPLDVSPNMSNYMGQMVIAMNKLTTLEGFVRQADSLRQQIIHRLNQILTTRQAARCFLAISEYFHRLRTLSSLWMARSRPEQA